MIGLGLLMTRGLLLTLRKYPAAFCVTLMSSLSYPVVWFPPSFGCYLALGDDTFFGLLFPPLALLL
jgi:hypothetical protein